LIPSWLGHSIGRWDGDALVRRYGRLQRQVLVRSPWHTAHRAAAHRRAVHAAELRHAVNDVTLEDPGTLAHPVKLQFKSRLMRPDRETGSGD
jgi:hypothetical protein